MVTTWWRRALSALVACAVFVAGLPPALLAAEVPFVYQPQDFGAAGSSATRTTASATTPRAPASTGIATATSTRPSTTTRAAASATKPSATTKFMRAVRYSGTGWGWLTPLFFAGTRVFEAATMQDASAEERLDHATKWAKNPRFWGAVAADMASCYAAEALVACLPFGPFIKNLIVCFTGFAVFEGVYGGFDQVDWKTLAIQSVVLTAVEMGVAALGLPLGAFFPILASFAVCMLLDRWDGFDGSEEDDEAYAETPDVSSGTTTTVQDGSSTAATATYASAQDADASRRQAYARFVAAMNSGDRSGADSAYADYMASAGTISAGRSAATAVR